MAKTEVLNLGLADSVILFVYMILELTCSKQLPCLSIFIIKHYLSNKIALYKKYSGLILSPVSQEKRFTTWIGFSAIYSDGP